MTPFFFCCRLFCLLSHRCLMSVFIFGRLLDFPIIVSKAAPFAHCLFRARICFCARRRSHGLLFRCRLVSVLWFRSPLGVLLMASKRAPFALCPFAARFAFCLSVCALSFRRSVSCFACCPAASRVCYCSFEGFCFFYYGRKRAAFAHRPCRLVGFF